MPEQQSNLYVAISDPSQLRKNILETSKEVIKTLKGFEELKDTRKRKEASIQRFKDLMRDITKDATSLRQIMPVVPNRQQAPEQPKEVKQPVQQGRQKLQPARKDVQMQTPRPMPKPLTEIERLQQDLSKIEEQLSGLKQ